MRPKRLRKKIQQLENRLQKDRRKLAKLEKKLKAVVAAQAKKRQKKASSHAIERLTVRPISSTASVQLESSSAKKVVRRVRERRKLNLSPERRAQLSAQMKARWAAKKGTAPAITVTTNATGGYSASQDFMVGALSQSPS